jgi:energy-coupling factor transport system ATP-binding protein
MPVSAAIAVHGLSCTYDGAPRPALAGVDLTVPHGALVVVMGGTGAGKSTLARCLTRIVPCFMPGRVEGTVLLGGQPIADRRPGELAGAIGMVFQDFEAQLFSSDVTQELVFGLEQTGVPPPEMPGRVRAALAAVGLVGFADRDPATLSGGEKQRLAIAGLLAMRPAVMLLDEPTTDLDPAGRAEVLRVLAGLRADGLTLVLIDHDPLAAVDADLLVLLHEGRVLASGPPRTLLADVAALRAAGVRPPDVSRVFAALALPDPPLDLAVAADRLRAARGTPRPPPTFVAAPARAPLIAVAGLHHRYADGRAALAGVTTTLGRGEFVALVGRNGSGKTTLAKHLNGLLRPTAGRVTIDGADVASLPLEDLAQRVGYVFQDPDHQLFASSVEEEVAFGPRNLGLDAAAIEARVVEALGAVGLTDRTVDPFLLDKGARQRLAVASVLALRPEVLVLDEPTTGLDAAEQGRMLALLDAFHRAGRTIVVITHTPWVVAEHAERVLLLADGTLRYDGPVRDFFADARLADEPAARPPDVTRLGRHLGCTPLTVTELVTWLGGRE